MSRIHSTSTFCSSSNEKCCHRDFIIILSWMRPMTLICVILYTLTVFFTWYSQFTYKPPVVLRDYLIFFLVVNWSTLVVKFHFFLKLAMVCACFWSVSSCLLSDIPLHKGDLHVCDIKLRVLLVIFLHFFLCGCVCVHHYGVNTAFLLCGVGMWVFDTHTSSPHFGWNLHFQNLQ